MSSRDTLLLYVKSPAESVAFYRALFEREPVESSQNFALFVLDGGLAVGLWARHDVQPTPPAEPGATELGITVESNADVDALYARWRDRKWRIAQTPTQLDFGYTFVALDPDGHRVRVYALSGG